MQDTATAVEAARNSVDASDLYIRDAQTFPVLEEDQVKRLTTYGVVEDMPKDKVLFERSESMTAVSFAGTVPPKVRSTRSVPLLSKTESNSLDISEASRYVGVIPL